MELASPIEIAEVAPEARSKHSVQVVIPPKERKPPMISLLSLAYIAAIFAFLLYYGLGVPDTASYGVRMTRTILFCAPIFGLCLLKPLVGMELFVASMLPIKILIDHQYVTNSVSHLLALGVPLVLLRLPVRSKQPPGRLLFLIFFYLTGFQFLRALDMVIAINATLSTLGFFTLFYIAPTRFSPSQIKRLAYSLCLGNMTGSIFILVFHDWSLTKRLGENLLLNANGVATSAMLTVFLWAYLHLRERVSLTSMGFYAISLATIFLSGSRTAALATALTLLLYFSRQKFMFLALLTLGALGVFLAPKFLPQGGASTEHLLKGLQNDAFELEEVSYLRVQLIQKNVALLLESPAFGVGLTNAAELAGVINPHTGEALIPHNMFLSVGVEMGFVGLLVMGLWMVQSMRPHNNLMALIMSLALMLIALLHGSFINSIYALPWAFALVLGDPQTGVGEFKPVPLLRR